MEDLEAPGQTSITLNGFVGEFPVPKSCYKIKFFSTIANAKDESYSNFLNKLEPLRDKVSPSSIEDLGTLLQRDIDDLRISTQILPYLLNDFKGRSLPDHIAFFPSVLCVLMPKGFLSSNKVNKLKYPEPGVAEKEGNKVIVKYENSWIVREHYTKDGKRTRYGQIEIFDSVSDFLVLDGQHRTNAFRSASKMFPKSPSIYENFYKESPKTNSFEPDLPVTIIWFELDNTNNANAVIEPSIISRQLFIDVNSNTKPIAKSRYILLSDRNPNHLITRFFYSFLSKNYKFNLDKLSLFHFGFDYDDDLATKKTKICPLSLFVPEILDYTINWFLFSDSNSYSLGKSTAIKDNNIDFTYFDKFIHPSSTKYFQILKDDWDEKYKAVQSNINLKELEETCQDSDLFEKIYSLFNEFPLIKIHLSSTEHLNFLHMKGAKPFHVHIPADCFQKGFLGGEGLYYSLMRLPETNDYKKALIEKDGVLDVFLDYRTSMIKGFKKEEVESVYNRISTMIFPAGYLMAYRYFINNINNGSPEKEFTSRISSIKITHWMKFFTLFWNEYFGNKENTPKLWPLVSNMIIRVIQKKNEFFDDKTKKLDSPDAVIFEQNFNALLNDYRNSELDGKNWTVLKRSDFPKSKIDSFKSQSEIRTKEILKEVGLTMLQFNIDSFTDDLFKRKVQNQ